MINDFWEEAMQGSKKWPNILKVLKEKRQPVKLEC
jgi:hypothetical protein